MDKKKGDQKLLYAILIISYILVLCFAGNLAYYGASGGGLERILMAFNDMENMQFHYSLDYLNFYGIATVLYAILVEEIHVYMEKYKRESPGKEAGSAKWNDQMDEYNKTYADPIGKSGNSGEYNMILSEHVRLSLLDRETRRNNNTMVVGAAGTGKSRFLMKPNMLQENCSMVITDPSGELYASLAKPLKEGGYKIKVFNLVEMVFSNCYNPFHYIRDEAGVGILVDAFISNTTAPEQKSSDPFWDKSERALLSACIFYLIEFAPEKYQNFSTILKMVVKGQMDENAKVTVKSGLDKLFEGDAVLKEGELFEITNPEEKKLMKEKLSNSQAWKNYQVFRLGGVRTLKSILISTAVRLNPFSVKEISNLTSRDDLELDKIGDEKTAMFVIIPQANDTYNFLASMMFTQAFDTLYYIAEQRENLRLTHHVRFLLDEFANTGKIPKFQKIISTMRKYNMSVTIILQSLAQLIALYKDDYETILGNCDVTILLGTNEQTTAKYFSDFLGKETIRARMSVGLKAGKNSDTSMTFQQAGRELMTPDEIRTMPNEYCLVFVRGEYAFYDQKYHYENHPKYKFTGDYKREFFSDIRESEFLNISSEYLKEKELAVEEPEEATARVSQPADINQLSIKGADTKDAFEILKSIQSPDRESAIKFLRDISESLDKKVTRECLELKKIKGKSHKEQGICIMERRMDCKVMPGFIRRFYIDKNLPIIIFGPTPKKGILTAYLVDPGGIIHNVLGALHIPCEKVEDFSDEIIVERVPETPEENFETIRKYLREGNHFMAEVLETEISEMADYMEE